jgi:carboxylesterase
MKRALRFVLLALAVVVGAVLVATALMLAASQRTALAVSARPATSYAEAVTRIDELTARDTGGIMRPTIFMGQGSRVATAVVLLHGFTNNPQQFEQIGRAYRDAGYNVLIPRLPEHGERDRMTRDLSKLSAQKLADAANEAIDIAAGLGDTVEVVGLSGGGTLAALVAHDRNEVTSVVIMSPLFGVDLLPSTVVRPLVAWSHVLPDMYFWWDPTKREKHLPPDAYPRYSLKSISAFFEVGYDVMRREPSRTTKLDRVALITNAADKSIDEDIARQTITRELEPISAEYQEYEYPKKLGYAHDIVDPEGLNAKHIRAIYSALYPYLGLPVAR